MKFSIITLFPQELKVIFDSSILGRGQKKGLLEIEYVDLRNFGIGRHQIVDSKPYGGGVGLVLRADTLAAAFKSIKIRDRAKTQVIMTVAGGKTYHQSIARELTKYEHIIIICGHYEGVDQRFITSFVDTEISIGDYVLTGGEIPAMVLVDSISRLIPGVLVKPEATEKESFENQLLEHPQYTRPAMFQGQSVPEILVSGHHAEVEKWRMQQSQNRTKKFRPELINTEAKPTD